MDREHNHVYKLLKWQKRFFLYENFSDVIEFTNQLAFSLSIKRLSGWAQSNHVNPLKEMLNIRLFSSWEQKGKSERFQV